MVQPHRHLVLAQRLDGLFQLHLALVDTKAFALQRFGDVHGGDGPEELVGLARLGVDVQH